MVPLLGPANRPSFWSWSAPFEDAVPHPERHAEGSADPTVLTHLRYSAKRNSKHMAIVLVG